MRRVVIDGNIGSGKSTVLHRLQQDNWKVIVEPIEEWVPYLEQFYSNMNQFSLSFQMKVLQHHMLVGKTVQKDTIDVVERSPLSCLYVFGKHLEQSGNLTELDMRLMVDYNKSFGWVPTEVIYIETDPEICQKRIQERNRTGETIPLEYLSSIDSFYQKIYHNVNHLQELVGQSVQVHIVNGNQDKDSVYNDVLSFIQN